MRPARRICLSHRVIALAVALCMALAPMISAAATVLGLHHCEHAHHQARHIVKADAGASHAGGASAVHDANDAQPFDHDGTQSGQQRHSSSHSTCGECACHHAVAILSTLPQVMAFGFARITVREPRLVELTAEIGLERPPKHSV